MFAVEISGLTVCRLGADRLDSGRTLEELNFCLKEGELAVISGANGSGKSTLLAVVAGLLKPTRGSVHLCGLSVERLSRRQLLPLVGIVFQDPQRQLFASSVREEIGYSAANAGLRGEQLRSAIVKAVRLVGLDEGVLRLSPFSVSEGERRFIALASVLIVEPKIVLLDEPTAGLDHFGRGRLLKIVRDLVSGGQSVLIASHEPEVFAELGPSRYRLQGGSLLSLAPGELNPGGPWDRVLAEIAARKREFPPSMRDPARIAAYLKEGHSVE